MCIGLPLRKNGMSERNLIITHVRTLLKGTDLFVARYLSMRVTYPVKFSQNTELERLLVHTP